jgi:hypothetical protein
MPSLRKYLVVRRRQRTRRSLNCALASPLFHRARKRKSKLRAHQRARAKHALSEKDFGPPEDAAAAPDAWGVVELQAETTPLCKCFAILRILSIFT